ncbi:ABC-2 family transporter protein, partial [Candidatus Roizmanbacteria bacterium]|nr:ABC-2 family transporter protein [Candidatus Roizmanbacteria bacterium]
LVGGLDFMDLLLIIPYFALTIFFILKIPQVTFLSFIFYLLFLFNALLIATGFHIIVLALGILTTQIDHTILIFRDLTSLGRFPIEIYKEPIRGIFTFVIPIAVMMSFPPKALFNLLSSQFIVFSFLVSCIILFLSLRLWNFALKQYQSWGG